VTLWPAGLTRDLTQRARRNRRARASWRLPRSELPARGGCLVAAGYATCLAHSTKTSAIAEQPSHTHDIKYRLSFPLTQTNLAAGAGWSGRAPSWLRRRCDVNLVLAGTHPVSGDRSAGFSSMTSMVRAIWLRATSNVTCVDTSDSTSLGLHSAAFRPTASPPCLGKVGVDRWSPSGRTSGAGAAVRQHI
jgi:hypothetical protein